MNEIALGPLRVPALALGTWSWGDTRYWSYEATRDGPGIVEAFLESMSAGVVLVDTAEVYGDGASERLVGFMAQRYEGRVEIATKFGLLPGRLARTLPLALDASRKRLRRDVIDLYQIHWPDASRASVEALMDGLADAVAAGKVRAVGVSNYSANELRRAHAALATRGIPLATCQVRYGLFDRSPEMDGIRDACNELGVALLAYSPLAQGAITGRFLDEAPGDRRATEPWFSPVAREEARGVVEVLKAIGDAHGRTPAQVALRWVIDRGAIPIAGARRGDHARENAGALSFRLGDDDLAALDAATRREPGA